MTGAIFVLAINMAIAMTMAIAFFAVGYIDTRNRSANWLGLAFLFAAFSFSGEYVLHAGLSDAGARIFIALTLLCCLLIIAFALARRYEADVPTKGFAIAFVAATILYLVILDRPRADPLRQFLYQTPYFLVTLFGVVIVLRAKNRRFIDNLLAATLALTALSFAAKPVIAHFSGGVGETPQDYATTLYAAISMSASGITALLFAMTSLAMVLIDTSTRLVRSAERDAATGLLNESGFEQHGARHIATLPPDQGHALVLTLVAIEPMLGGPTSAAPGRPLADALSGIFGPDALISRISGMQFAVLMPETNLFGARRLAELLRARLAAGTLPLAIPSVASVGLAEYEPGDSLPDMVFRAQWALDEARRSGGNTIRLAARSTLTTSYAG